MRPRNRLGELRVIVWPIVAVLLVIVVAFPTSAAAAIAAEKWTIGIRGGLEEANKVASEHGCKNLGLVRGFQDVYLFEKQIHPNATGYVPFNRVHRTKRRLELSPYVLWVDPQFPMQRVKRDLMDKQQLLMAARQQLLTKDLVGQKQQPAQQQPQGINHLPNLLHQHQQQTGNFNSTGLEEISFDDELWNYQWYLKDNSNVAQMQSGVELNVEEVWKMGFFGQGIVVTILDDGLEWNHTDLKLNYDPLASWDMNNNKPNPFPKYDSRDSNNHGTRCAGEVAMVANNRKCGVGVAPRAKIGGIKCLDGEVADHIESSSLIHNLDHVDIYSASWGPADDGKAVEGPKRLASQALEKGVRFGRKGRGALYVWANGNGGAAGDNCNCDGYANSIYTISVGAVTQQGQKPFYGERCASTLAVTCSSGFYSDRKIVTTDLHNKCTVDYTGTSAAAPLAAGVFALVLEANGNLTWRDAQHLTVWTSNPIPIRDNPGWKRNGAGLIFNNRFGFGLLDAKAMVDAALKWQQVPKKSICIISPSTRLPVFLQSRQMAQVVFVSDGCRRDYELQQQQQQKLAVPPGSSGRNLNLNLPMAGDHSNQFNSNNKPTPVVYLEHVQIIVDIEYTSRGSLDIFLVSPAGTISTMLTRRPFDTARTGFDKWPLMSVHFWAESSIGKWTLMIRDKDSQNNRGLLRNATLVLHGTTAMPAHMAQKRVYLDVGSSSATSARSSSDPTAGDGGFSSNDGELLSFIDPVLELDEDDVYDLNTFPNEMSLVRDDSYEPTLIKSLIAMEQQNQLKNNRA